MSPKGVALLMTLLVAVVAPAAVSAGTGTIQLQGAGATFPHPFYQAAFDAFTRQRPVSVQYVASGSGEGIRRLLERQVDFGATDAFMTRQELEAAPAPILHVPTCLGAVVLTYHLPGDPTLRLSSEAIGDLFLGKIRRWNDPQLVKLNPDIRLPDLPVQSVYRSDSSGTTFIFSDYLSRAHSTWKEQVGSGRVLQWPVGIGGKGNPGVASLVKQRVGALGYVELIYALGNDMRVATVQNRAGNLVVPTVESVTSAAQGSIPDDTNVSLTDTDVSDAYPISGFTWLAFYREQEYGNRSRERAENLAHLLWWLTHEGQALTRPLHYAPLPDAAVRKAEGLVRAMTYRGQAILR